MDKKDFEKVKELLEGEGFSVSLDAIEGYAMDYVVRVGKKDIWEGVKFVEDRDGNVYRFIEVNNFIHTVTFYDKNGDIVSNSWGRYKPSTKEAYVEQLKKEAFERFGNLLDELDFFSSKIDRSNLSGININESQNCGFKYFDGNFDSLYFNGLLIYERGKWAKN